MTNSETPLRGFEGFVLSPLELESVMMAESAEKKKQ